MSLTWHIIWKDMRRLRMPIALWTLLMVAKHAFYASISGVGGVPNLEMLRAMASGPAFPLSFLAEPAIAYFLVASLVFQDPLVERDAFWVTRPISGTRLLAAKLLGAGIMFVLLPLLVSIPWWLACGLGYRAIAMSSLVVTASYSFIVIAGLACAAATDGFPRYVLWTVAGIAALAAAHIVVSLCVGSKVDFLTPSGGKLALRNLGVFLLCVALVSAAIIRHQYVTRFFRRSIVVAAAAIALSSALYCTTPTKPYFDFGDLSGPEGPGDDAIHIQGAGNAIFNGGQKRGDLRIPLTISGERGGLFYSYDVHGTWSLNGVKVWEASGFSYYDFREARQWISDKISDKLLNRTSAGSEPVTQRINFQFSRKLIEELAGGHASFHASVDIGVAPATVLARMPLRPCAQAYDGGSFSISDISRTKDEVSFVQTERSSPFSGTLWFIPWQYSGFYYYALVRRSDGAVLDGKDQGSLYPWGTQLDLVSVASQKISFKAPPDPGWIDDVDLVVVRIKRDRGVVRTVDVDPLRIEEGSIRRN